jgi:hypothetical protein
MADFEFHLRDTYDAKRQARLTEEEAFHQAVAQVGTPGAFCKNII